MYDIPSHCAYRVYAHLYSYAGIYLAVCETISFRAVPHTVNIVDAGEL